MVCAYCSSLIVRRDMDVSLIGEMAALPDDMSPFQIGSEGYDGKKHFTLIGRLRLAWENGSWNEWCMMLDDGTHGWLAEAQGFFMIYYPLAVEPPPLGERKPGEKITLDNKPFYIADIKRCVCAGSDGELPFPAPKGRRSVSVDINGKDGLTATIDYGENEQPAVYVGHYASFDSMRCSNLRELEGWRYERAE